MKKQFTKHWTKEQLKPGCLPITTKELIALGVPQTAIDAGEMRGEMETFGPWQLPVSYSALCGSTVWTPKDKQRFTSERESETFFGIRKMTNCHQSGYCLEGRVSVNGKKYRAFTSSQLFQLENGKLVNVATIHACMSKV